MRPLHQLSFVRATITQNYDQNEQGIEKHGFFDTLRAVHGGTAMFMDVHVHEHGRKRETAFAVSDIEN
jgi:hypothetical protein